MSFPRLAVIVSILASCSTLSTRQIPPLPWLKTQYAPGSLDPVSEDLFLQQFVTSSVPGAHEWALYHLGTLAWKHSKTESCKNFEELAKKSDFPLAALVRIRKAEACGASDEAWNQLVAAANEAPWLLDLTLDQALKATEGHRSEMRVLWFEQKAIRADLIEEQLRGLEAAQAEAKEIKSAESAHIQKLREELSPSLNPSARASDDYTIAQDFRRRRLFDRARDYYRKMLKDFPNDVEQEFRARAGIRQSFKLERRLEDALNVQREMTERAHALFLKSKNEPAAARRYLDATNQLVRALWTQHHDSETIPIFESSLRELQGYAAVGELLWIRARMFEEKKDFNSALEWSGRALLNYGDSLSLKEKITWQRAWILRKLHRYDESAALLDTLISKGDQLQTDPLRYNYWKARSLTDKAGGTVTPEAAQIYNQIKKQDRLSYYALLAQRELKENFQPLTDHFSTNSDLADKPKDILEWLIAVDELEVGQKYLNWKWNQMKHRHYDEIESMLLDFARVQSSEDVFRRFFLLPVDRRNALLDAHPSVIFPRPFFQSATQAATRFEIEPSLVYAIIRQESAFNPKARSFADAFGLMQLTPETALRIAKKNDLDYSEHEDLFDPEVNMQVGTAYLHELSDEFDGQFIMMVASYNASHEAARGWVKSRFDHDATEFIEDIPYEETRSYVRLVMRNKIFYDRFFSTEPFAFPEGCLKGLQNLKL